MAKKTKPYGVRFNENKRDIVFSLHGRMSYQKLLNFYEGLFDVKGLMAKIKAGNEVKNDIPGETLLKPNRSPIKKLPPEPKRMEGESNIDFLIRKNEWKELCEGIKNGAK